MAKMKWTKPSAETVAYFERIAPGPPIEARRMFGMPARFLNGHMLVGVSGNTFMLHLSAVDRAACVRAGAKPFAPMGREAKAYVDVKPGTFDDRTLKEWIVRGMRYLASLPPKLKKKRAADTRGTADARARGPRTAAKRTTDAPARSRTASRVSASAAKRATASAPRVVKAAKKARAGASSKAAKRARKRG
jgi:TfoX/Sxy family transcriptional regulator of competence genes